MLYYPLDFGVFKKENRPKFQLALVIIYSFSLLFAIWYQFYINQILQGREVNQSSYLLYLLQLLIQEICTPHKNYLLILFRSFRGYLKGITRKKKIYFVKYLSIIYEYHNDYTANDNDLDYDSDYDSMFVLKHSS